MKEVGTGLRPTQIDSPRLWRRAVLLVAAVFIASPVLAQQPDVETIDNPVEGYGARVDVQDYVWELAQKYGSEHNFTYDQLMTVLAQAERKDSIIKLMDRTPEGTWTWTRYRKHFLDDNRIQGGVKFWRKYAKELQAAEDKYGVAQKTIVAIIGVETRYGTVKGKTRILDALMTLAFDFPRRAKFFRKELTNFVLLLNEEDFDALEMRGSYAGAMGWGQFMPSSYREYAVDFDSDGVRDLLNNPTDAIGSVANYLSRHGWKRGLVPAVPAQVKGKIPEDAIQFNRRRPKYLAKDLLPYMRPRNKKAYPPDQKLIALKLKLDDGTSEYWLGSKNLYVITRYNTSLLYAMAVHELGDTIQELLN